MAVDAALAARLLSALDADLSRDARLGKVRRYLKGEHDEPYMPRGAREEYKHTAKVSITNVLPRIPDTFAKALFVDGYRAARASDNAPAWDAWQANGMDARQSIVHRGALQYGTSYLLILPGKPQPVWRPYSPLRSMAWYEDEDAEWPDYFLAKRGKSVAGDELFDIVDREALYECSRAAGNGAITVGAPQGHPFGFVPVVRFRERIGEEAVGLVAPYITTQDRLNEVVFAMMVALQYGVFRQRWATGLAIPVDENETMTVPNPAYDPNAEPSESNSPTISVPNPNYGHPVEPFKAAVDRLWVTDNPDAKFGDFAQTDITGYLALFAATLRAMGNEAGVHPGLLFGDMTISNVSEDTTRQLQAETFRKREEYQTLFGEAWEQAFRLSAIAAGDTAEPDVTAQVRWRDTDGNGLAATVDALTKLATGLQVPVEALWEMVPGITDQTLTRWKALKDEADPLAAVAAEFTRQTQAAVTPSPTVPAVPAQAPPAAPARAAA
jgi:hypothetical protein